MNDWHDLTQWKCRHLFGNINEPEDMKVEAAGQKL